ncbi:hypothetical protein [Mycolicibacterium smegmatis]|uniref:Uncharacterized protein n=1 Tax=Mycolicibacterium smegmatis (strain MKD8) TaxID=1214915 RepID=A0A2U9Q0D9_MYCSE|nr:hypothetical protein [Mycolicibacterium smegmatis]AWT57404.1 hypothetical protein D806_064710 [Mycolicibacterium smegmatis MKD8]
MTSLPPPPSGPQQQQRGNGPTPSNGDKVKWIFGGLAVVLAIALAVVVTVLIVKPDSENASVAGTPSGPESDLASTSDTSSVNVITEDSTCDAWGSIGQQLATAEESVNWADRDYRVPATSWSSSQRAMYETVAKAMTAAAEKTRNLETRTPHRVLREVYGQFVAYTVRFVDRLPSYVENDDDLAAVVDGLSSALSGICSGVSSKAAAAVEPLLSEPDEPSSGLAGSSGADSQLFIERDLPVCAEWESNAKMFADEVAPWRAIDPNIPYGDWTREQQSVVEEVRPVMSASADELERLGRRSGNPVFEDFAVLAAQYRRAFVAALPAYTPRDNSLSATATYLVNSVLWACKAAS